MKQKIDYTKMDKAELSGLLEEKRNTYRELRFRVATHELKTVHEIDKLKKEIARLLTALNSLKA